MKWLLVVIMLVGACILAVMFGLPKLQPDPLGDFEKIVDQVKNRPDKHYLKYLPTSSPDGPDRYVRVLYSFSVVGYDVVRQADSLATPYIGTITVDLVGMAYTSSKPPKGTEMGIFFKNRRDALNATNRIPIFDSAGTATYSYQHGQWVLRDPGHEHYPFTDVLTNDFTEGENIEELPLPER